MNPIPQFHLNSLFFSPFIILRFDEKYLLYLRLIALWPHSSSVTLCALY
jgi:hypothetical protein